MKHPLTLACGVYDRTSALSDGRVRVEGVDLTCIHLPVEEIFFRMARFGEFDVAEMSLSSYTLTLDRDQPFVAIPVFLSRSFRHNSIYVNAKSGINRPEDLIGRVVGVPEYQVTAAVWIRGLLAEHHGVPIESVRYRTGGQHDPGRVEKLVIDIPGIDIQPIPEGRTLSDMLVTGELDAIYSPRIPRPFADGNPAVRRLWTEPREAEVAYYKKTGIFPIMHTVVIRREVYEQDRWLAGSLLKAFIEAKQLITDEVEETAALSSILPWSYADAHATRAIMGQDFWPYGVAVNEHVLATFLGYLQDQQLIDNVPRPSELFAPETLDAFVI